MGRLALARFAYCSPTLRGGAGDAITIKNTRTDVGAIRPNDRPQFRINLDLPKHCWILPQGVEDRTSEVTGKIDRLH